MVDTERVKSVAQNNFVRGCHQMMGGFTLSQIAPPDGASLSGFAGDTSPAAKPLTSIDGGRLFNFPSQTTGTSVEADRQRVCNGLSILAKYASKEPAVRGFDFAEKLVRFQSGPLNPRKGCPQGSRNVAGLVVVKEHAAFDFRAVAECKDATCLASFSPKESSLGDFVQVQILPALIEFLPVRFGQV